MNPFQNIFALFYAILFGTMLQSLASFQPFPLAQFKERWKRVILSFVLLNALPFLFFAIILHLFNGADFNLKGIEFLWLVSPAFSALGVFAFYRIYHAAALYYRNSVFKDRWDKGYLEVREMAESPLAHLLSGLFYIVLSLLSVFVLFLCH